VAWQILVEEALRQIEGQLGGPPLATLVVVENWTERELSVPINVRGPGRHDLRVVAAKGLRSW